MILLAVGTPPGPDGSADLSFIFKAAEQVANALTGWAVLVTKSTVPVGTGDKIEAIVKKHAKHEFAVASNPEFLKEGRRGQRLHEAGSRRHRRRRQARGRHAARAVRAVHAHERSHAGDGSTLGRADQVRRQLDAGDAHLVHERPRQPVRAARRRHRAGPQGHGLRRAHRPQVPVRRPRLRRQLLPEGPARRGQHRAGGRLRPGDPERRRRGQRAPEAEARREGARALRRQPEGQADRGLGAGVQARDRRHPRGAGAGADRSAAGRGRDGVRDRSGGDGGRAQAARRSHRVRRDRTTTAPRAPTRWCWSPSGTSSGARRSSA